MKIRNRLRGRKIAKSLHLKERKKQLPGEENTLFYGSKSHFEGDNYPSEGPKQGFWTFRTSIIGVPNKQSARTEQAL
ncbi:hypothetical protein [uncultured Bacteroides sp.]|uniref:hypothetical protein n=1 Tax=uncultured Bacteroides sp. TaxID=162156 RepID=UPI00262CE05D|nr:hypothetical protein [uncultured Bacteroides sp.]